MTFRFNAINCTLTYPQCESDKQCLFDYLLQLKHGSGPLPISVEKLLVAQEEHEDGGKHYHCYIRFSAKPNIRNERFFDFDGHHPNIQSTRSVPKWIEYCTKEDTEPLANFEWKSPPTKQALALASMRQAIEEKTSIKEAIDRTLDVDPILLRSVIALRAYYDISMVKKEVHMPLFDLSSFSLTAADYARMSGYAERISNHQRGVRSGMRCMWFVGTSRNGKTALSRSLGSHWFISQTWNLDRITDEAKYGVIDDISWDKLRYYYKALLGLQSDISLTDKYRSKTFFKFGIPVLVTSNELPNFTMDESSWLRENVDFFKIVHKIEPGNDPVPFEVILI